MVFLEIMPELQLKTVRPARIKGVRGRKTGRVCKAVVRQGREAHNRVNICLKGREAHNRVNICLKYRDLRGRHHRQFRMPEERADSRKGFRVWQKSRL